MFLYSIINFHECKYCDQELLESYLGLTKTYLMGNKIKKAKKVFITAYNIILLNKALYVEEDIDFFFDQLKITPKDILKKNELDIFG